MGKGPDEEEVGQGDEAEDVGVVVCQGDVEGKVVGEGVLEEDEAGEGGAAAELVWAGRCQCSNVRCRGRWVGRGGGGKRRRRTSTSESTRDNSSISFRGPRSSIRRARSSAPSQLLNPPSYTSCSMSASPSPAAAEASESAPASASAMICMRTSKRARRGMRARRSCCGEMTRVVV